ncbi:hypothetical protein LLG46_15405 [bacterium]|nr:hypothetical protein [bacterium]
MLNYMQDYYLLPDDIVKNQHDVPSEVVETFSKLANDLHCDLQQLIDVLLNEKYVERGHSGKLSKWTRSIYYLLRPFMGVGFRRYLQRAALRGWDAIPFPHWPVDTTIDDLMRLFLASIIKNDKTECIPFVWFWPKGFDSCVIMTHDVESQHGLSFCGELMDIDDSFGIKSSFQLIPERRYHISANELELFRDRSFEINVHDLNHDGHLFEDEATFLSRIEQINKYGKDFGARGFRSGVLYRRQEWYSSLKFSYDMSVPNVAHLDPQKGGCCSVFPYYIDGVLEIPLTTIQDYSLLCVLNDYSTKIWNVQCGIISDRNGLMSFNVHPDYIRDKRAMSVYQDLLGHIRDELIGNRRSWHTLPGRLADWWKLRQGFRLEIVNGNWEVTGPGCENAAVGFATLRDGALRLWSNS